MVLDSSSLISSTYLLVFMIGFLLSSDLEDSPVPGRSKNVNESSCLLMQFPEALTVHLLKIIDSFAIRRWLILPAWFNADLWVPNQILAQAGLDFFGKVQLFKEALLHSQLGKNMNLLATDLRALFDSSLSHGKQILLCSNFDSKDQRIFTFWVSSLFSSFRQP